MDLKKIDIPEEIKVPLAITGILGFILLYGTLFHWAVESDKKNFQKSVPAPQQNVMPFVSGKQR